MEVFERDKGYVGPQCRGFCDVAYGIPSKSCLQAWFTGQVARVSRGEGF